MKKLSVASVLMGSVFAVSTAMADGSSFHHMLESQYDGPFSAAEFSDVLPAVHGPASSEALAYSDNLDAQTEGGYIGGFGVSGDIVDIAAMEIVDREPVDPNAVLFVETYE